ncbi:iron ABC transporter permease [Shinella sp. 838]|jgi:iron complex transport system permease protein|uniref:FecCD family ABC transporter permease n=2 Tax=Shinella TaxID=323620 RepID=UPI000437BDB7|nr:MULTISPECIES: iron ABC transporter permease [unclassified Shinella]EYR81531.1 ABC-type Fe3+-siderophore transport system permease component [Shinella sp. DD12]MCA0342596.1 iron ABC transporter permease [Pseudomonadota bacterium]MDG4674383.1 iron ABC transporter permease [Shinella sp. 838]
MMRLATLLAVLLAGLVAASLAFGDISLSWRELMETIAGSADATPQNGMIVFDLRLPRILLALLVGAALATAGTIALAIMRNPLAEPGALGINSGAAAAVMGVIVLMQEPPVALLPLAGFLGAAIMAAAVYLLSWQRGTSSLRIILIGIGLGSLASAATTFLSAFGEIGDVQRAMIWLAGSVYEADMVKVRLLFFWLLVPLALAWMSAGELDLIRFGDNSARSLGQRVDLVRGLMIVLCTLLSGAAVAAAGLIGFVGLVAPHIASRLAGPSHARILPIAALSGAILVVASDLLGRLVIAPAQLPAGIVTGLIGAPFFAYLLWGRRHVRG